MLDRLTDPAPTDAMTEARRAAQICNACRYCESYCPVFPAMFQRRDFPAGDLSHLANLCHNCKGCWHACQYAPPHEFGLNLPATLAASGQRVTPNTPFPGRRVSCSSAMVWLSPWQPPWRWLRFCWGAMLFVDDAAMTGRHSGPGAFYAVIPHNTMIWLGGLSFGWAILAMIVGVANTGAQPVRRVSALGPFVQHWAMQQPHGIWVRTGRVQRH